VCSEIGSASLLVEVSTKQFMTSRDSGRFTIGGSGGCEMQEIENESVGEEETLK